MALSTKKTSLGEVCEIAGQLVDPKDGAYRAMLHVGGANIVSRTGELIDLKSAEQEELISGKYCFTAEDVLYSKIRPYLQKVALPDFHGLCSADIYPLRPDRAVIRREYLYYLLLSSDFTEYANRVSNRAGMPKINRDQLFAYRFDLPSAQEQDRIVRRVKEMFGRVEEARTLRGQSIKEIDRLDGAVFADFAEAIQSETTPFVQLRDLVAQVQYGTSQKAHNDASGTPILRMGNIKNGVLDTSDLKYIDASSDDINKYRLQDGDILFNRTNSLELVGKAATFRERDGNWLFASYLVRIVVDQAKAHPDYISAVINSRIGRRFIYQHADRAIGMVNINAKKIQALPIPLPPLRVQEGLVQRMQDVRKISAQIRSSMDNAPIDHLSSVILRKAFAGDL